MTTQVILDSLSGVKPQGSGRWKACCPAHDDSDPSLVITEVADGRILIHCFAGCSPGDILSSVGLSMTDLFPEALIAKHHLYGGDPMFRKNALREEAQRNTDELILKICDTDRRLGKKLSAKDLKMEREAFKRIHTD